MTKLKKISEKKYKKIWIKNYNLPYLSLGLQKGRPSYRTLALKREHPALQNMKFQKFSTFVGCFCPPGSGSTDLIESGSTKRDF
jgi:hypothetical protein